MPTITQIGGKAICEATGKKVVAIQINFPLLEAVSITMTYYPDPEELAKLAPVFEAYKNRRES